jgi:hypothetical protein
LPVSRVVAIVSRFPRLARNRVYQYRSIGTAGIKAIENRLSSRKGEKHAWLDFGWR